MNKVIKIITGSVLGVGAFGAGIFTIDSGFKSLQRETEHAVGRLAEDVLTKGGMAIIDEAVKASIPVVADEIALNLFVPGFDNESIEMCEEIRKARDLRLVSK